MPNSSDSLRVASTVVMGPEQVPVDFIGVSNIWVDESFRPDTLDLTQALVLKALQGTAPGQLELVVYDYRLSGFAAPFAGLQAGTDKLLTILTTPEEVLAYCNNLRLHIQGVKNVIQGRQHTLREFRAQLQAPVESYKMIVLVVDFFFLGDQLKEAISLLMTAGPAAGVSFLVVAANDDSAIQVVNKGQIIQVDGSTARAPAGTFRIEPVPAAQIISECDRITAEANEARIPPVRFQDIQPLDALWTANSTNGITFSIGQFGVNTVEVTLGNDKEQRHNMLVTGAVGQGKSNLLAIILHSLCQRYSPDELELYLLDFKEGVTLQNYSNLKHEDYLPHAQALGLEADTDFGIAVLTHLYSIYEQRMRTFKDAGLQSIKQYREAYPEQRMPRILLIIDEFQMMFSDRDTSRVVAALLSKCARLFRAAGIHILLASQTISSGVDLPKDSDVFAQTPIRVALKNSIRESEATLGLGNSAATDLHMGQAILNVDYGAIASNRKVSIALADEKTLAQLRRQWWERARTTTQPPFVFDGNRSASLASVVPELIRLRAQGGDNRRVFLGEEISVRTAPQGLLINRAPGRNLAILGLGDKDSEAEGKAEATSAGIGMMQSAALALAFQHPAGDARFVCFNFLFDSVAKANNMGIFEERMSLLGFPLEKVTAQDTERVLTEVADSLASRAETDDRIYLLGFAFDQIPTLPKVFERIIKEGPSKGVHVLGWWQKTSAFQTHVGFGNASAFDIKAFLRVDERDVSQQLGPFVRWQVRDNRALIADTTYLEQPIVVIPFMPLTPQTAPAIHL